MVRKFMSYCMAGLLAIGLSTAPLMAQDASASTEQAGETSAGGHQMFKQRFLELLECQKNKQKRSLDFS